MYYLFKSLFFLHCFLHNHFFFLHCFSLIFSTDPQHFLAGPRTPVWKPLQYLFTSLDKDVENHLKVLLFKFLSDANLGLTCLHNVLQSWESLAHSRTDGAQDEDWWQVCVSHQSSPQQTAPFICAMDIPRHNHHQVIWQGEACILTPPALERLCDIEP